MRSAIRICALVLLGVTSPNASTQTRTPKSYVCFRAVDPITIDGKLTERSWQAAQWTDLFVDVEGDKKPHEVVIKSADGTEQWHITRDERTWVQ